MSRSRRALSGYVTDVAGQVLLTAATLASTPLVLHFTSAATYGFWATSLAFLAYFGLVDLGLGVALIRSVAMLEMPTERNRLNRVTSTAFFAFAGLGAVLLLIGTTLSIFLPSWLHVPIAERTQTTLTFATASFTAAVGLPLGVYSVTLMGMQRLASANLLRVGTLLVGMGTTVALLATGFGAPALAIGLLVAMVLNTLVCAILLRRAGLLPRIRAGLVDRGELRALWRYGGHLQVSRLASTVSLGADGVIIGIMLGAAAVTPYTLTNKLAILFSAGVASKAPIAVFPALSQMFAREEWGRLREATIGLCRIAVRLGLTAAAFVAFANPSFVARWVGPENFAGSALNWVFVFWIVSDSFIRGMSGVVQASGNLKAFAIVSLVEAAAVLVLMFLLAGPLGIVGIALGVAVGRTLTTGLVLPWLVAQAVKMPLRLLVVEGLVKPALQSIPGLLATALVANLVPPSHGWFGILLVGLVAVVGNVVFFEGAELMRNRNVPIKTRIRKIFILPGL